jgi:hypothetical protein
LVATNLDDTSSCLLGVRCESCGVERDDLAVRAAALGRLGVACLTLCPRCAGVGGGAAGVGGAVRVTAQHREHLCITWTTWPRHWRRTDDRHS